jgi:colanic acid biosynthesis glycosyl transferase WcaI
MNILDSLSGYLLALFATSWLSYFLASRAHTLGLVDKPSLRKGHEMETPTIGGIAIFGGFLLALFSSPVPHVYLVGFVLPALLLVGVGAIDDAISISYKSRFFMQILAGLLMTLAGGVMIDQLGALLIPGTMITLGVFAIPFTLVCLVGLVNAFNMCDGIDGLAGSLTLVAILGLGTVAYLGGRFHMVESLSFLGFSLMAFLAFNARLPWHKRAVIFLGDSGSTFLGFAVMWFAVNLSQGEQAVMTPVTPLWFIALPFFDMATVLIMRLSKKQSPFEGDREHFHHIFLAAGFSVNQTVLILTATALLLALIGVAGQYLGVPEDVMFASFLAVYAGFFFLVRHSWKRMRFLGREICRRAGKERRSAQDRRRHPGITDQKPHEGANRRCCEDRRVIDGRRRLSHQAGNSLYHADGPLIESVRMDTFPKTVFVNRYFWPDHSATSQLLSDLAFSTSVHGRPVAVITSRQRYDDPLARLPDTETSEGVIIHRVWTSHHGRQGLKGRAFDYLTFYLSASWRMWRTLSRGDIVVAMTDPPLICIPAAIVAALRGARLVIWHQDLFPEVASVLRVKGMRGKLAVILTRLRNISVHLASVNVVLSRNMAQRLIDQAIPAEKIRIIPNWSDGSTIYPTLPDTNPLRAAWGLRGRFVVGYSGNMGRVHEFNTLLDVAERFREDPRIVFLFIGNGFYRTWIGNEAKRRGLSNIMFQPYQPRKRLIDSLGVPDVHVISLLQEMDGLVFPSKLYGILAASRPSLFIGAGQGDVAHILRNEQCGFVFGVGDAQGLAEGIMQLKGDPELRHAMGHRARALFERHYDVRSALLSWCHVFMPLLAEAESCQEYETRNAWAKTGQEV